MAEFKFLESVIEYKSNDDVMLKTKDLCLMAATISDYILEHPDDDLSFEGNSISIACALELNVWVAERAGLGEEWLKQLKSLRDKYAEAAEQRMLQCNDGVSMISCTLKEMAYAIVEQAFPEVPQEKLIERMKRRIGGEVIV